MASLKKDMTHAEMIEHLLQEVCKTARYETGRLVKMESPAFFGAVRAIMCDLDYVAALFCGWDRKNRREIATGKKTAEYLTKVCYPATRRKGYTKFGRHLYDMYRVGTVHLRAPKRFVNSKSSTPELSWCLMFDRREPLDVSGRKIAATHLVPVRIAPGKTLLPVSIKGLFEDFIRSCEYFARLVRKEELVGGRKLLDSWRSVGNALIQAEPTNLLW